MLILHRYVARMMIAYTLLVLVAVIGISFLITLLSEFRDIGSGDYGILEALFHAVLSIPKHLYQFFPMIGLLGAVLSMGLLASHQELMVMRASGISFFKLVQYIASGAVILILVVTLLGEWVSPQANFLADKRKQSAENGGQAIATAAGVWIHEGNNFFHVDQVIDQYHLEGVTRYQFGSNQHLLASYFIPSMKFNKGKWIIKKGVKTSFYDENIKSMSLVDMSWATLLNPSLLTIGLTEPEEMSLAGLHRYNAHLVKNGLQATEFQFAFWTRILQPLSTLVMVFLAIPFVLITSRNVVIGRRILLGVIVGFGFYILNAFLGELSIVFQFSPFIAALLPIILLGFFGYFLSQKALSFR